MLSDIPEYPHVSPADVAIHLHRTIGCVKKEFNEPPYVVQDSIAMEASAFIAGCPVRSRLCTGLPFTDRFNTYEGEEAFGKRFLRWSFYDRNEPNKMFTSLTTKCGPDFGDVAHSVKFFDDHTMLEIEDDWARELLHPEMENRLDKIVLPDTPWPTIRIMFVAVMSQLTHPSTTLGMNCYTLARNRKEYEYAQKYLTLLAERASKHVVCHLDYRGRVRETTPYDARDPQSLVGVGHVLDSILKDVNRFRTAGKEMRQKGLNTSYNYVFSGPPGTGKTSVVRALATQLNMPIYTIDAGSDERIEHSLVPSTNTTVAIILCEDVDRWLIQKNNCHTPDCDEQEDASSEPIVSSSVLNALDGVSCPKTCYIRIFTVNDEAELRKCDALWSRVDRVFRFGLYTADTIAQRIQYALSSRKDITNAQIHALAEQLLEIRPKLDMRRLNHYLSRAFTEPDPIACILEDAKTSLV